MNNRAVRSGLLPALVVGVVLAAALLSPARPSSSVLTCYGYSFGYGYGGCGAPTVTSVWPYAGPITGGTTVNITGTNFNNFKAPATAPVVKFGGVASPIVIYMSDTLLRVASPAHAAGVVDVTVTTAYGQTSATNGGDLFRYVNASYCAAFILSKAPTVWKQNVTQSFALTVFNCGLKAWPATGYNRVNSNTHFTSRLGSGYNTSRYWIGPVNSHNLAHNIGSNRGLLIRITITPRFHGTAYLEVEMVKLHQFYFGRYLYRPPQFKAVVVVVNP
jgi:hypothetical protein